MELVQIIIMKSVITSNVLPNVHIRRNSNYAFKTFISHTIVKSRKGFKVRSSYYLSHESRGASKMRPGQKI